MYPLFLDEIVSLGGRVNQCKESKKLIQSKVRFLLDRQIIKQDAVAKCWGQDQVKYCRCVIYTW